MPEEPRRLWLIDAGYLLNAQTSGAPGYRFSYLKLRTRIEESGALWRAYYLNSTSDPPSDAQNGFHTWLRSGPPRGPKIITKLYSLKSVRANRAYCQECKVKVDLKCPTDPSHHISNQQQKGVDVGLATLALIHREKYDTLIISSGDGDLLDAVEFLWRSGSGSS